MGRAEIAFAQQFALAAVRIIVVVRTKRFLIAFMGSINAAVVVVVAVGGDFDSGIGNFTAWQRFAVECCC